MTALPAGLAFSRRLNEPAEAAKLSKFRASVASEYALICF